MRGMHNACGGCATATANGCEPWCPAPKWRRPRAPSALAMALGLAEAVCAPSALDIASLCYAARCGASLAPAVRRPPFTPRSDLITERRAWRGRGQPGDWPHLHNAQRLARRRGRGGLASSPRSRAAGAVRPARNASQQAGMHASKLLSGRRRGRCTTLANRGASGGKDAAIAAWLPRASRGQRGLASRAAEHHRVRHLVHEGQAVARDVRKGGPRDLQGDLRQSRRGLPQERLDLLDRWAMPPRRTGEISRNTDVRLNFHKPNKKCAKHALSKSGARASRFMESWTIALPIHMARLSSNIAVRAPRPLLEHLLNQSNGLGHSQSNCNHGVAFVGFAYRGPKSQE